RDGRRLAPPRPGPRARLPLIGPRAAKEPGHEPRYLPRPRTRSADDAGDCVCAHAARVDWRAGARGPVDRRAPGAVHARPLRGAPEPPLGAAMNLPAALT